MSFMVVTLDVFQLETSALKLSKPLNSPFMLSMDETSHLSMAPYMAMVAVGLALKAWTAAFREAVLVKVPGRLGCGGEGGEGDEGGGEGDGGGGVGGGGESGGGGVGSDPMARSTGSHCGRQATPRTEARDFELE